MYRRANIAPVSAQQQCPVSIETSPAVDYKVSILQQSVTALKTMQRTDGYWWFALEANESIGSEFIFLMHYLDEVDESIMAGIAQRIRDMQRSDGSWTLYYDGPGHLSASIECYFALKLAGFTESDPMMAKARDFIRASGGIERATVFTKIHLAMFGLVPWSAAPAMPVEFMLLPSWFPVNIYSFSSWARATIVPLLVFMSEQKTKKLNKNITLDEIFLNRPDERDYAFHTGKSFFSWESWFIRIDKYLKWYEKLPWKPLRNYAKKKCLSWTWEHVSKTEDIYPAMAYAAFAAKAAGFENSDPRIRQPFEGLKMFQQYYATEELVPMPDEIRDDGQTRPSELRAMGIDPRVSDGGSRVTGHGLRIHQQCCISPLWDTPWTLTALLDAGTPADDPDLLRSGRWLLAKQITDVRGDWAVKNPNGVPGGWPFEFENDYFPDIDDSIQILSVLHRLALSEAETEGPCKLGLDWVLSMQNDDGGWGAFDKNQTQELVNRIPFSDHKACLDPSSPDIAGRVLELLAAYGFAQDHPAVAQALSYIWRHQESFGGWFARWGINYIYGTWCVLTGLSAIGWDMDDPRVLKAIGWLRSVQNADGGFGESAESYDRGTYVPLGVSTASQTAWGLMGLVAAGRADAGCARRAAEYLLNTRNRAGAWDEQHYTGTGFPGHFYIRYHGYRHFFPVIALARYQRAVGVL